MKITHEIHGLKSGNGYEGNILLSLIIRVFIFSL